jgi:magnesium chelatase subunit D
MTSTLLVFVVDASGSMGTRLMTETKGAILQLLIEAYQKRDKVCLVAFRGNGSVLLLPPTNSVELAKKKLADLPTGGRTPLSQGLLHGYTIALQQLNRNTHVLPLVVLITDGKANVGADPGRSYAFQNTVRIYQELYALADMIRRESRIRTLVIDAEEQTIHTHGIARRIAERMGATYTVPAAFRSTDIASAVRKELCT